MIPGALTFNLDGLSNSDCAYSVSVTDLGSNLAFESLDPAFVVMDATFSFNPFKPNHVMSSTDAYIQITTLDEALEGFYDLRVTVSDL